MTVFLFVFVIVAFIAFKWRYTILVQIRAFTRKDFEKNPKVVPLTLHDQKVISLGLLIAEQHLFYADSLETGALKAEQMQYLSMVWGVVSPETAMNRLNQFLQHGIHRGYDSAISVYRLVPRNEWKPYINLHYDENVAAEIYEYVQTLEDAIALLKKENITDDSEIEDVLSRGCLAWDLGRLIYIGRAAFLAGYITEQRAWDAMRPALAMTTERFATWQEFGQSYMLGRAIWSVDDSDIDGLFDIYRKALSHSESPWMTQPLR